MKEEKEHGCWGTRWGRTSPGGQLTSFSRTGLLVFAVEKKNIPELLGFHLDLTPDRAPGHKMATVNVWFPASPVLL